MNLNIDYKRKVEDEKQIDNIALSVNYIEYAINNAFPQGLEGQKRRVIGRIQRKLEDAQNSQNGEINFEAAEVDELKEIFKVAKFPPALSKYVVLLEEEVNKLPA
jgi:hypothetical protein